MAFDGGWEVTHVEGRQYVITRVLGYDAKSVAMEAFSRPLGKPGGGGTAVVWRENIDIVRPGDRVEADLDPTWPGAPLPFRISITWHDEYGERLHASPEVPSPSRPSRQPRPDLRAPVPPGFVTAAGSLATRTSNPSKGVAPGEYAEPVPGVDPRDVFVVIGRNKAASDAMFAFLRAIGLNPIEWSKAVSATGSGSPYTGHALDAGFAMAQAVVVLLTPDDIAQLRPEYASDPADPELTPTPQARPNVLFEAGMALGLHPDRTILVELGSLRPFSDVTGRHTIRMDNSAPKRNELANRLRTAGCAVDTGGSDWYSAGDFTAPRAFSGPTGRRIPSTSMKSKNHLDARYLGRGSGSDKVQVINIGSEEVFELRSQNTNEFHGHLEPLRVARLPVGKTATLTVAKASGHPDAWDLIVNGRTESGTEFTESLYLDLNT